MYEGIKVKVSVEKNIPVHNHTSQNTASEQEG